MLAQTHGELRLIVAEDGPGGGEIEAAVRPYLDDGRVSYSPSGEHLGAARTMSRIIASGDAPYVAILHDDDRWHSEWLERRVRFLEEHPDCGMVFGKHLDIDAAGRVVGRSNTELPEGRLPQSEFVPAMLRCNHVATPTVLVRRAAYEATGPEFDASYELVYDYEMMFRLALVAPAGHLHVWDSEYRSHGVQLSSRAKRGREYLRLYESMIARARAAGFGLPDGECRVRHSRLLLAAALDEAEDKRRAEALRLARAGMRRRPRAAFSASSAALFTGLVAPRLLGRVRQFGYQRSLRPDTPV